ncbi:MAG: RagB/SusD family nutrient uptake outer membrane protein [Candidatus Azobacteroides sp.]|nr:RagB/SusD family nutrient uptake outer membrane protein [Candidatus Azobacteroides sp.]
MKTIKYFLITVAVSLLTSSCGNEYLNADYKEGIDSETVDYLLQNSPDAVVDAYVRAIYSYMVEAYSISGNTSHDIFTYMSIMHTADMTAQDMVQAKSHWFNYDYDFDNRMFNYRRTNSHWTTLYTMIAKANTIINLYKGEPENPVAKAGLGQALAIRALSYYYLIQLYQKSNTSDPSLLDLPGVPLRFADSEGIPEEERTNLTGRNTVKRVHEQIEKDLMDAVKLLKGYKRPYKYFVDENVAKGILARFYLLSGQWAKAETTAREAHSNYNVMSPASLHDGFMDIENAEWMWGFKHTTETQTGYASFFSQVSNIAPGYAGLNYAPRLIDAALYESIPETDERKSLFNDSMGKPTADGSYARAQDLPYANLKFGDKGDWTMDYVYMRAAEMVLIEAEALAHQGKNAEAAIALKKLMNQRDPKWNSSSVTVDEVFQQRRIELWGEGFGYFDLKRLNKGVDRNYSGSNHRTKIAVPAGDVQWTYQLPNSEIQENPLITENNP